MTSAVAHKFPHTQACTHTKTDRKTGKRKEEKNFYSSLHTEFGIVESQISKYLSGLAHTKTETQTVSIPLKNIISLFSYKFPVMTT